PGRPFRIIAGPIPAEINLRIPLDPELAARLDRAHAVYRGDGVGDGVSRTKSIVQRKSGLVNVTVERPPNNVYFRGHPSPEMQLRAAVVKNREGSSTTTYYIPPAMQKHPKLEKRLQLVTLALVTTWPVGNILIWPVPIPGTRDFKPWKSAYTAFERAQELW